MDIVGNLPVELAQEIFMKLSPDDVYNAWRCSKRWKYQMDDEIFWKKKCKLDDFKELKENVRSEAYNNFTQHYSRYWMGVYMYYRALYYNWRNNVYKETTVLGENIHIAIKYLDDEIAILVNLGRGAVVLDSSTGNVQKMFTINESVLCDIQKYEDLIVSRGNQSFKVWNIRSGECVFQYAFEESLIKYIKIYKNFVAAMDHLSYLHVIDIETGKVVYRKDSVVMLDLNNDMLALANCDGDIEILTLNFSLVKVLESESKFQPLEIVIKGNYLIHFCRCYQGPSHIYFAFVWNAMIGELLHKFTPVFHYKASIFLQEDKLIYSTVSDQDNRDEGEVFKYCNYITGEVFMVFTILHNSCPYSAANNKFIFLESSSDGTADGFCLETGNLVVKTNIKSCLGFLMTERKLAYFDDELVLHILNYEHDLKY